MLGIWIRMFLGLPDQDPLVRCTDPAPDPYVLSGKFSKQCTIFLILKVNKRKESDPELDPDPLVRGMGPGIRTRIHTKMSRIPNTGKISPDW